MSIWKKEGGRPLALYTVNELKSNVNTKLEKIDLNMVEVEDYLVMINYLSELDRYLDNMIIIYGEHK